MAMNAMRFLIWSNEQGAWRSPHGYTWVIERAARYDRSDAQRLIGPVNIVKNGAYHLLRETIVPAPEEAIHWETTRLSRSDTELM